MTNKDTPNVQFSIAKLRKEVEHAETLRMPLSGSKIMAWPDIYAMDSEAAEVLFEKINANRTNWKLLAEWLTPEDCKALKAEKLTLMELNHVVSFAVDYYEAFYGKPGKADASES